MSSPQRRRTLASSPGLLVPAATITANVLSYALVLIAARLLDRAVYGETLALLNLVTIATIPAFAIQTVAARRAATATVGPALVRVALLVGVAGALVIAAASPLAVSFMRLDSYLGVLAAAASVPSLAVLGLAQGATQGREKWVQLCLTLLLMGVGRVGGGIVGLTFFRSSSGALIGTALGLVVAALIAWPMAKRALHETPYDESQTAGHTLAELAHAAHAHGVFLLLSSLDLLLARNVLSADDAGLYAAGNVIFRAALWLPQPVALMLFAALSDFRGHRRKVREGLVIVGALAGATILGSFVFGDLAAAIVGGAKFADLADEAWIFALAGSSLAVMQFCIFAGLAMLRRRRLALVWACIVAEIVAAMMLGQGTTPMALISSVATIVAVAAAAAAVLALRANPTEPIQSTGAKITEPL
ncbi:hypothetical protein EK0264_03365 [Epidermidibacterium keratini]|uniref:Polysaccharide biosynthesis protein n=1 Tax=Epidermidibacterium keratini TaxID=1891644 RepID=A0A7L4YJD8_9ACTN|nr:hypothetical protein [Epidermidibacterium keratini]QHB99414.1 hypothetical protein EK0264_03365 [Epidermidibacterium keratini]